MTAGDLKLQDHVNHMLDATRLTRGYLAGISKADFLVVELSKRLS